MAAELNCPSGTSPQVVKKIALLVEVGDESLPFLYVQAPEDLPQVVWGWMEWVEYLFFNGKFVSNVGVVDAYIIESSRMQQFVFCWLGG